MKFRILFLFFVASFLFLPKLVFAIDDVNVYFFWGDGCPHCAKEEELLDFYKNKYPYINVIDFEIYKNSSNGEVLREVAKILNARVDGVPFTVVGDKYFIGYNETITPNQISERIEYCHTNACPDSVNSVINNVNEVPPSDNETNDPDESNETTKKIIKLPIIGEVDTLTVSLPLVTILIGILDGFNPCAMWTLLFLISLLLGMENKKRMWFLGTTFIIASALVYFTFMAAWLNLILFIGFVIWVRLLIGAVALFAGIFNLKNYFLKKSDTCEVTNTEKRQKVFSKLKELSHEKSLIIAFFGIILLAFAVNLVELVCSAGLPAVYTQILAINNLSDIQYYLYILLYILFFMIDDLIIFIIAMLTLQITGISTKYSRYSKLIGGLLMLIIGALLIFKPEWLMFG